METYMTICKIDNQQEFSVWLRKLKQGFCINLEGWGGREMGGRFKREGVYVYLPFNEKINWKKKESLLQLRFPRR